MTEKANAWVVDRLRRTGARSIFVPAGNTPTPLYAHWEKVRPDELRGVRLLQIDDVLTGAKQGIFANYFQRCLPSYAAQLVPIVTAAEQAGLAILGFGVNGHVAFHEPGLPADFRSGCVRLSEESRATLGLEAEAWGVTYGVGAFLETKCALLMVSGAKKSEMFGRFLIESEAFPAALMKAHPDLTVLVDFDF